MWNNDFHMRKYVKFFLKTINRSSKSYLNNLYGLQLNYTLQKFILPKLTNKKLLKVLVSLPHYLGIVLLL